MEIRKLTTGISALAMKYKYAVVILIVGLVLMVLPTGNGQKETSQPTPTVAVETKDASRELADILGTIQGVGKVNVLLTVKAGERTIYQSDEDTTVTDTTSSIRKETVIITDSQRNQQPLVVQILPPEYLGAVIVCQGAENAGVRLAVVEAVCKATGLGADKITVLKMK